MQCHQYTCSRCFHNHRYFYENFLYGTSTSTTQVVPILLLDDTSGALIDHIERVLLQKRLTWLGGICFPLRRSSKRVPKLYITLSAVTLPTKKMGEVINIRNIR